MTDKAKPTMQEELVAAMRDLIADIDDVDDGLLPTISSATLTRARIALRKATEG